MQTFLFSTFTGLPARYFDGYCFAGKDYVFGHEGMIEYESSTGLTLAAGMDGCYVFVKKEDDGWAVGGDHSGFKKLFYYLDGPVWCISNSIEAIADHLVSKGVRLAINHDQVAAQKISSNITTCLSTFQTIFHRVRLLPSYAALRIDASGVKIINSPKPPVVDYRTGLGRFLETWVSRFETLLADDRISIGSQLTGGKDSRAVFALLQRARQRLGETANDKAGVISGKSPSAPRDYEIAAQIADRYRIPIAGTHLPSLPRLSTEQSYEAWKQLSLGLYNPIYFPNNGTDGAFVQFSGIGGETHRPFYQAKNPEELIRRIEATHPRNIVDAWKPDFQSTLDALHEHAPETPPLIAHYREFRSRIHGGRTPQNLVCFPPLSSHLLDGISVDEQRLQIGQVNFDIMESALPGLLRIDYDKPSKRPTPENIDRLSVVPISHAPSPGRAFLGGAVRSESKRRVDPIARMALLNRDYTQAVEHPQVRTLLGEDWISACNDTLSAAVKTGKLNHAWSGMNITRTLTVALALTLGSE